MGSVLPNQLWQFIWRYLRTKKLYLFGYILVALVWAVDNSLSPYLLKKLIDSATAVDQTKQQTINAMILFSIGYGLMPLILNLNFRLYDYINLKLYPYLKSNIASDICAYLLHHSYDFFQNTFTGNISKKIADLIEIEAIVNIPNVWFLPRLLALIMASSTLWFVISPVFGIVLLIWSVLFISVSYYAACASESLSRKLSESKSRYIGTITDTISNILSTKLFGNMDSEQDRVNKSIDELVNDDRAMQWFTLKTSFVQGMAVTILTAIMLIILLIGRMHGWISAGDFAMVLSLTIMFTMSLYDVGQQMQNFSKVVGTANQALKYIIVPHGVPDAENAKPICVSQGKVEFRNIEFKYNAAWQLFDNLNVVIEAGQKVGLVGYSGGGKSTFAKLLLRLIDPDYGQVLIDNQDLRFVTKNSIRKQIATIPQETELFHRTIMENIRFARQEATDEEVIHAAKEARCHEFVIALPEQYQSLVGERGVKLSGGQRQRIAIARAFLKNAPILLLDEATSSLDSVTENEIQESLYNVMKNKTTIVIAHRLSTLKNMDRILVFQNGKIVEDGCMESLLKIQNGHFAQLWHMQVDGFIHA